jgi:hypothetical protein
MLLFYPDFILVSSRTGTDIDLITQLFKKYCAVGPIYILLDLCNQLKSIIDDNE